MLGMLLSGCASVNTSPAKQAALQGCCVAVAYTGRCMPSRVVPNRLECVPMTPEKPSCINEPFRCDRLHAAVPDDCWQRNPRTGFNSSCRRTVNVSGWDPYGYCVKGQCSDTPPQPAAK